jgi:HEAT repeat protein
MTTPHLILALLCGSAFLAWLGVAAYVVAGRTVHDVRARRLERAASGIGLSRRAVLRAAGDPSLPQQLSQRLGFEAAAVLGRARLVCRASRHRTEIGKWRRAEALRILALVDEAVALPLLDEALRTDEDLAAVAAAILGGLGSAAAARVLAGAIEDAKVPAHRLAAYLDGYEREIPEVVGELAAAPGPARRYWGVSLLSRYTGREQTLQRLCAAAADPEPNVRAAAAEALGAVPHGGLDALRLLVRDPAWFVRAHAARAIADRRAPMLGTTVAPLLGDESWWVRSAAKDALTSLGAVAAAAVAPYLEDVDTFARNGAVEVLERVGVVDAALGDAALAPHDPAKRSFALAIIRASGAAYFAAIERAAPELREPLLALGDPLEQAA